MTIHERAIASYPAPTRVQIRRDGTTTAAHSLAPGAMAVSYGDKRLNVGVDVAIDPSGIISFPGVAELAAQLANYETSAHAAATYLTQANAASTYETSAHAAATYLTQANAASTYLTQANAASTYLTQANAAATYLTQANAAATYLTPAQGDARYLKPAQAAGLYLPLTGGTLTGPLGINKAPTYLLDAQNNVNADASIGVANPNTGAAASSQFVLKNSASYAQLCMTSTAYPVSGPVGPDQTFLLSTGAGGMALGTWNSALLKFVINDGEVARFSTTGLLGIGCVPNETYNIILHMQRSAPNGTVALLNNSYQGSNASAQVQVSNTGGSYGAFIQAGVGSGFTAPYASDQTVLQAGGAGGLLIETMLGVRPIIFAVNEVEIARFNNFGLGIGLAGPASATNLIECQKNAPGSGVAVLVRNTSTTGYAQFLAYNNVGTYGQFTQTDSAYVPGSNIIKPDQTIIFTTGANGLALATYNSAPVTFGVGASEVGRFGADGFFAAKGNYGGSVPAGAHNFYQTTNGYCVASFQQSVASPSGINACQFNYTADPNMAGNSWIVCYGGLGTTYQARMAVLSNGGISNYAANNVNISDAKLKDHIEPLKSQIIAKLWNAHRDMAWSRYRYKDQTHDDPNWGYLAQDVAKAFADVAPELVDDFEQDDAHDPKTGEHVKLPSRKGVYSEDLHNIAHALLSEAQRRIEALEADMKKLRGTKH